MRRILRVFLSLSVVLASCSWPAVAGAQPLPPAQEHKQYLPLVLRNYCGAFFDGFSDPGSGWPIGENSDIRFGYAAGEYQAVTKVAGVSYAFPEPSCARAAYSVEADMRWLGDPGELYGLAFGIVGQFAQGYVFLVDPIGQRYALVLWSNNAWSRLIGLTASPAIRTGQATNHLRAEWTGSQIALEINGTRLDTIQENTVKGLTTGGLFINGRNDRPVADARYDNFVTAPLSGAMSLRGARSLDRAPDEPGQAPLRVAPVKAILPKSVAPRD
jgi:hypothetical protein